MRLAIMFGVIALAGMATAWMPAGDLPASAQEGRITAIMADHGFSPLAQPDAGEAVRLLTYSSPQCGPVQVVPISLFLQESAQLRTISAGDTSRNFLYVNNIWQDPNPSWIAWSHLKQTFAQMVRLRPLKMIDTMLFVSSRDKCRQLDAINWKRFWEQSA